MPHGQIEHVNITVSDPDRLSAFLQKLLGWHVRWRGPSQMGGETIHLGTKEGYLAIYGDHAPRERFAKGMPLNHVGFQVDDLDAAETIVLEAGLEPFGHDDYDPGRRFYFFDWDGIEFEVACYG